MTLFNDAAAIVAVVIAAAFAFAAVGSNQKENHR